MDKLLHLGCADDVREGFDNLDRSIDGWTFESGLPQYASASVAGITISHALMYVPLYRWAEVCAEFYRVLMPGGVVRITEDDTERPSSPRYWKPYPGAACETGPVMARSILGAVGFYVRDCEADEASDPRLIIAHRAHKVPNYVFYIEGIKGEVVRWPTLQTPKK